MECGNAALFGWTKESRNLSKCWSHGWKIISCHTRRHSSLAIHASFESSRQSNSKHSGLQLYIIECRSAFGAPVVNKLQRYVRRKIEETCSKQSTDERKQSMFVQIYSWHWTNWKIDLTNNRLDSEREEKLFSNWDSFSNVFAFSAASFLRKENVNKKLICIAIIINLPCAQLCASLNLLLVNSLSLSLNKQLIFFSPAILTTVSGRSIHLSNCFERTIGLDCGLFFAHSLGPLTFGRPRLLRLSSSQLVNGFRVTNQNTTKMALCTRRELKQLFRPHYLLNILFALSYLILKKTPHVSDYLFANGSELDHVSISEWNSFDWLTFYSISLARREKAKFCSSPPLWSYFVLENKEPSIFCRTCPLRACLPSWAMFYFTSTQIRSTESSSLFSACVRPFSWACLLNYIQIFFFARMQSNFYGYRNLRTRVRDWWPTSGRKTWKNSCAKVRACGWSNCSLPGIRHVLTLPAFLQNCQPSELNEVYFNDEICLKLLLSFR